MARMIFFARSILLLTSVGTIVGCNRQDTESLSRMGRKIAAHTRSRAESFGSRLELGAKSPRKEPTLQEKIQDRLRWENTLTEIVLEVRVKEKEVELHGSVKNALQRQRAIELAETVAGVDKVTDSIEVRELAGENAK